MALSVSMLLDLGRAPIFKGGVPEVMKSALVGVSNDCSIKVCNILYKDSSQFKLERCVGDLGAETFCQDISGEYSNIQ